MEDLNGRDALIMKVAAGVGERTIRSVQEADRAGDPRFLDAIQDNLRRWYGMELVPAS